MKKKKDDEKARKAGREKAKLDQGRRCQGSEEEEDDEEEEEDEEEEDDKVKEDDGFQRGMPRSYPCCSRWMRTWICPCRRWDPPRTMWRTGPRN
jgi:hypothetical protein